MIDGWFFIFFGLLLVFASVLPRPGKIRRNFLFGIRLEPFMRSERAWRDGHRGAAKVFLPAAGILFAYGTCMLTLWPRWITHVGLDLLRVGGIVILLIAVVWGTLHGASAATENEAPTTRRY